MDALPANKTAAYQTAFLDEADKAVLTDPRYSPSEVMRGVIQVVHHIAPGAEIVITGDFVRSVQDNFEARGISVKYGVARGANTVSAKTMRSPGGGATIYVPLWLVIGQADETSDNLKYRVSYLLHMAAHEATHALNIAQGESSEAVFGAMGIATASDQYYAQEAGTVIEEYRAQLTAEEAATYPGSWLESLSDDIFSFSQQVSKARRSYTTDLPAAARIQNAAGTNLNKALALAAAEARVREAPLLAPLLSNSDWLRYAAQLWDDWTAVLLQLPPGHKLAGLDHLGRVTRELMELLPLLETLAGITRSWDDHDAPMMFWTRR